MQNKELLQRSDSFPPINPGTTIALDMATILVR
jgi:hypothetical protein